MSFSELLGEEFGIECAEALAAKKGLEIAWDSGVRKVILELDCLSLVNDISRNQELRSNVGMIVKDIVSCA